MDIIYVTNQDYKMIQKTKYGIMEECIRRNKEN